MSREVKRVPLDFDWPLHKIWSGYLIPKAIVPPACAACGGMGQTSAALWVQATANMLLMLDGDLRDQAFGRPMHPYFDDYYSTAYGTRPSPDIHELAVGLEGHESGMFGFGQASGTYRKIVEAAGLDPAVWGICPACRGEGSIEAYPGQLADMDAWERSEPPAGDGWQMWESVSEGSPISPVLASPEELARWLADNGASTFADETTDYEHWLAMIREGSSMGTFVMIPGRGLVSGVDAVSEQ